MRGNPPRGWYVYGVLALVILVLLYVITFTFFPSLITDPVVWAFLLTVAVVAFGVPAGIVYLVMLVRRAGRRAAGAGNESAPAAMPSHTPGGRSYPRIAAGAACVAIACFWFWTAVDIFSEGWGWTLYIAALGAGFLVAGVLLLKRG